MPDEAHQAAKELVAHLQETLAVFAEQQERADAARQQAQTTGDFFTQAVAAKRAGAQVPARSPAPLIEETSAWSGLTARWEAAFCGAYEALMRHYAHPQARQSAERIAASLRAVRLTQVEEPEVPSPGFAPPPLESGISSEEPTARLELALGFLQSMDSWREQVESV